MNFVARVAVPPAKPLVIFDGDCGFCRKWIARWKQTTCDRVDYEPLQSDEIAARFPELRQEQLQAAVHLVQPDGSVSHSAEAVFRLLAVRRRWPLWLYENVPGIKPVTEVLYQCVAANRSLASWLTTLLWGARVEKPTYVLVRWLFLRLLGATYLVAFLSLQSQWPGLIGSNGIVPARAVMRSMESATTNLGLDRYHLVPSVFWLSTDDAFLQQLCMAGVGLSVLVLLNVAPALCLLALWVIYLSFAQVSTVFLGFQWDNLLLEAGFLAIFFAPWRPWPNLARERPPSRIVLWLLRWLLFRLMFCSGAVKLLSGDVTWRNLTALTFHYETQPLPTPLAWYVHHWPFWAQKVTCGLVFGIELLVPFLIFLPRRPRLFAFWTFVMLMAGITLTGNYTFFIMLTAALCVTLLDDFALARFVPEKWSARVAEGLHPAWLRPLPDSVRWARNATLAALTAVVLTVTGVELAAMARRQLSEEQFCVQVYQWVAPFRSINSYGLFAVMTTSRPEIIIEGSQDGRTWLAYEFRHKPGDLHRRPTFVAPHQPRLDWQMWFAALGSARNNPWFGNFLRRLLQGKPEVLALLGKNPFPDGPPKYIRAKSYDYHFTTPTEREKDGTWWKREPTGEYYPQIQGR